MCYAFKLVRSNDGVISKVPWKDFKRLEMEGKVVEKADGFHYAKDNIPVIFNRGGEHVVAPMRWDLIPADFLKHESIHLPDAIRKKNSRAINPATGKTWGFSSFNARVETVDKLVSFSGPWKSGKRCVVPVTSYKERPNMDNAPAEFKGREYEVRLDGVYFFAGLYDHWESKFNELLDSCTIITMDSKGVAPLEAIWHERIPVILDAAGCERWLDLGMGPAEAMGLCKQLGPEQMTVVEIGSRVG